MKKIVVVLLVFFLSGCVTSKNYRTSPAFTSSLGSARKVVIMPVNVKVYKLSAGGIPEEIDEWTLQAKQGITENIGQQFSKVMKVTLDMIDYDGLNNSDQVLMKEQNGLYNAVASSIITHTYVPETSFQHKIDNFDYSLGKEVSLIPGAAQADMLLFTTCRSYFWSGARTASAFLGIMAGAFTGVCVVPADVPDYLAVSLVDARTGDVLWFNYTITSGDMRVKDICAKNLETAFHPLSKDGEK